MTISTLTTTKEHLHARKSLQLRAALHCEDGGFYKKKKIKRFIQDETKVPGRGTVTVPVESESP